MKFRIRFKLRTLLVAAGLIALALGVAVNHWNRSLAQRDIVAMLESYGDQFRDDHPGSITDIYVYYDDELSWRKEESRFVRDLPFRDHRLYGWIRDTFGRDFVDSPVALEISCNDYDLENHKIVSTFDKTIIERIQKLSTIRQLWIIPVTENGKNVNAYTNEDLRKHFPDMIFSPIAK